MAATEFTFDESTAQFTVELVDKVTEPAKKATSALSKLTDGLKSVTQLKAFETLQNTLGGLADSVIHFGQSAAQSLLQAGMAAAQFVTKGVVGMAIFADSSRRAFASLTGGAEAGAEAFERSKRVAREMGMDVQSVAEQFKGMLAMQFKADEAEGLIKMSADLVAVTGKAEAAQRAIVAITQIKAKGKLQAEELVGQLAEAGVATTLVYKHLGQQLGKTEDEVRALIGKGQVKADQGIAAIQAAVLEKVHGKKAGEAGAAFAQNTISGLLGVLQSLPNTLFLEAAEKLEQNFEGVKDTLRTIIDYVRSIDAGKIAAFVSSVLTMVQKLVPLALSFAEGFGEGFQEILAGMTELSGGDLTGQAERARELGRDVAKFFSLAVRGMTKLMEFGTWLTTSPVGQAVAGLTLVAAFFVKALLWVAAIKTALVALGVKVVGFGAMWSGITSAVSTFVGWLVTGATWIGTILGAIISLPGLIAAATAALVAGAWIWREELAKAMLWLWDTAGRLYDSFVSYVWKKLGEIWTWLMSKLPTLPTWLGGSGAQAPAQAPAPTAPQAPELSDTMKGALARDQKFETTMTVNVQGMPNAGDPKTVGEAVGKSASDEMEGFWSSLALQGGA